MADTKINVDELKLLQNVINRMGINSFKIKGWAITLIVGALILKSSSYSILIAFLPLIVFWVLDAIYLQYEKRFRELYRRIVNGNAPATYIPYSMDISKIEASGILTIMFSTTIGLLYGLIGILIIGYFLLDFL